MPTAVGRFREQAAELIEVARAAAGAPPRRPPGPRPEPPPARAGPDRAATSANSARTLSWIVAASWRAISARRPSRTAAFPRRNSIRGREVGDDRRSLRLPHRDERPGRLAGEGLDGGDLLRAEGILGALDRHDLGHGEDVARREAAARSGTSAREPTSRARSASSSPSSTRTSAGRGRGPAQAHRDVDLSAVELAAEHPADVRLERDLRLLGLHREVEKPAVDAPRDDLAGPVLADRAARPAEARHAAQRHGTRGSGADAGISLSAKYCMSWSLR